MNIFRLAGDMSHLASILVLYHKIAYTRSCKGISLKTVELYALVFLMRYLDLFTNFFSLYNSIMKMLFIGTTLAIVYQIRYKRTVKVTYDKERDTFRSELLIGASVLVAFIVHERIHGKGFFHYLQEISWMSSIYLEAVAILPQLTLLMRTENIDNLTGNYVFLLGAYRGLYIFNWIYRFYTEPNYQHWLVWLAGVLQTGLYADFFYYYFKSWKRNEKLKLPA